MGVYEETGMNKTSNKYAKEINCYITMQKQKGDYIVPACHFPNKALCRVGPKPTELSQK